MRNVLQFDQLTGKRFELALERFREGHLVCYKNAQVVRHENRILCSIETQYRIENVNETTAVNDFKLLQDTVEELRNNSEEFAKLIRGKQIVYSIVSDYGMGAVEICSKMENGQIVWNK